MSTCGKGRDALVSVLVFLLAGVALAEGTYLQFLQALANAESSNQPGTINRFGYVGLFQMGELALQDAGYYRGDGTRDTNDWTGGWTGRDGINSLADFRASPQAQINAITRYDRVIENFIAAEGASWRSDRAPPGLPRASRAWWCPIWVKVRRPPSPPRWRLRSLGTRPCGCCRLAFG